MDRETLVGAFKAAVAAADPMVIVPGHLPPPPHGRLIVVGAGKAAGSMALAVDRAYPDSAVDGMVVTRYGHGLATRRISVVEASHPVPDSAGEYAARQILGLAMRAAPEDLMLVLISGGASSLLALPVESVPMADLKAVTHALLRSGADIREMNCVRKHLSRIAGGHLAAASEASIVALMISDVPGDDPSAVGSGPTVPDPTTYADALAVLARRHIDAPFSVRRHLEAGAAGVVAETPKPGDACFARVDNRLIATARGMLAAGSTHLQARGWRVLELGEIEGDACTIAQAHAALVRDHVARSERIAILSGGELTVNVRGSGRGGRCSEYLMHLARALDERGVIEHAAAIACDTDGIDGSENNAGALLLPDTMERVRTLGIDADALAANNDAWSFFDALGDLVVTGPTRTNVNDFRVILVDPG